MRKNPRFYLAKWIILLTHTHTHTHTGRRLISARNLLIYRRFTKSVSSFFVRFVMHIPLVFKSNRLVSCNPSVLLLSPDYFQNIKLLNMNGTTEIVKYKNGRLFVLLLFVCSFLPHLQAQNRMAGKPAIVPGRFTPTSFISH